MSYVVRDSFIHLPGLVGIRLKHNAQARLVVDRAARVVRLALLQALGEHQRAGNRVEHCLRR